MIINETKNFIELVDYGLFRSDFALLRAHIRILSFLAINGVASHPGRLFGSFYLLWRLGRNAITCIFERIVVEVFLEGAAQLHPVYVILHLDGKFIAFV